MTGTYYGVMSSSDLIINYFGKLIQAWSVQQVVLACNLWDGNCYGDFSHIIIPFRKNKQQVSAEKDKASKPNGNFDL
jgi:hypothetical protein